jgi:hypothetical protein
MAFALEPIHRALAAQIKTYLTANGRDTNVDPFPSESTIYPSITVEPNPSGYIPSYFDTFGPAGYVDLYLRLRIEVNADSWESEAIKITDYLSVGTGNGSSICDAIRSDKTLAGLADDCYPYEVEWSPDEPNVAFMSVKVLAKKSGAQP